MAGELGMNPKDLLGLKKVPLSLVPPASLIYQALAMKDGAAKYSPYNWRENKVVALIYIDACLRHLQSWVDGEEVASDSGVPHLGHALACLGIIVDAKETGNLVDNRPKPGVAAALLERYTVKAIQPPFKTAEVPPGGTHILTDGVQPAASKAA